VFDEARLATDLGAIVDDHIGGSAARVAHYTFLLMLEPRRLRGLEHRASSVNLYHRTSPRRARTTTVARAPVARDVPCLERQGIAPRPLLAFDYAREACTPCLWTDGGPDQHYDRFALRTQQPDHGQELPRQVLDDWRG